MKKWGFGVVLSLAAVAAAYLQQPKELVPEATLKNPEISEMSGIVKSRRYDDVFWVHNDSGDSARFFAIRSSGEVVMPQWVADEFTPGVAEGERKPFPGIALEVAANNDWEDIAIDGDTLYLADVGNNGNARRDLGVYMVREPNPAETLKTRTLKWLPIQYPDQKAFPPKLWHFDCEAVFVFKGKLHFLTKHRQPGQINRVETGTKLYRLDTSHSEQPNVLTKLDEKADLGGWITAADMSPGEKRLAVLAQHPVQSVWLFDVREDGRLLSGKASRLIFTKAQQAEAVCFVDEETLLVTNEQGQIFRLRTSEFTPVP